MFTLKTTQTCVNVAFSGNNVMSYLRHLFASHYLVFCSKHTSNTSNAENNKINNDTKRSDANNEEV